MKSENKSVNYTNKLFELLRPERKDIYLIYLYGIFLSLINLSLPLGVQAVVTRISGGVIYDSIYILVGLVAFTIAMGGVLLILQVTLVEVIQRRLFARASLRFSQVFLQYDLSQAYDKNMPEKANRFFDILTIQKGLPKLLGDLSAAIFQIFFSILILSFYHPYFIFLAGLILGFILVGFSFTVKRGLNTSLEESNYKYKVAFWLEEMARTSRLLRTLPPKPIMEHTNSLTQDYLNCRSEHFKVLLNHYGWVVGLKVIVIGGLLFMGAFLVSNRMLSLGQFIASEIIIILLINAIEKIILYLDVVYDLITGSYKLSRVTDMPEENAPRNTSIGLTKALEGITIKDLGLESVGQSTQVVLLPGLRTDYPVGSRLEADQLTDALLGGQNHSRFAISMEGLPIYNLDQKAWRSIVQLYSGAEDILAGTLEENIVARGMGDKMEEVLEACRSLGIFDSIVAAPEALAAPVLAGGYNMDGRTAELFPLALSLATKPQLLIWNDTLQYVSEKEKKSIMKVFLALKPRPILLVITPKQAAGGEFMQVKDSPLAQDAK